MENWIFYVGNTKKSVTAFSNTEGKWNRVEWKLNVTTFILQIKIHEWAINDKKK